MPDRQSGKTIGNSITITPAGSTVPVTLDWQKHSRKGEVEVKKIMTAKNGEIQQPMGRKVPMHDLESLIPDEGAAEFRTLLLEGTEIDTATFPGYDANLGKWFVITSNLDDDIADYSKLKITVGPRMAVAGAA